MVWISFQCGLCMLSYLGSEDTSFILVLFSTLPSLCLHFYHCLHSCHPPALCCVHLSQQVWWEMRLKKPCPISVEPTIPRDCLSSCSISPKLMPPKWLAIFGLNSSSDGELTPFSSAESWAICCGSGWLRGFLECRLSIFSGSSQIFSFSRKSTLIFPVIFHLCLLEMLTEFNLYNFRGMNVVLCFAISLGRGK